MSIILPSNAIVLDQSIAIYVPSSNDAIYAQLQSFDNRVHNALVVMSDLFGGSSSVRITGGYVMGNGDLVMEDIAIVRSYYDPDNADHIANLPRFLEYAHICRGMYAQESIAVEIQGQLVLLF